jgi:hypothetical protein
MKNFIFWNEYLHSSEWSVYLYFYQTLQRHIPEVRNLHAQLGSCESV